MKKLLAFILFIFLFNACSFIYPVFIINTLDEDAELILGLKNKQDSSKLILQKVIPNDAINLDKTTFKGMKLAYQIEGGNRVSVKLPANSTVYLTSAVSKFPAYFSYYYFRTKNGREMYSEQEFLEKLKRRKFYNIFSQRSYFVLD